MSRTVRRTVTPYRAGLAAAAAVVLLTACGGGSSDTDPPRASGAADSTAADFCARAAGIDERVDSALSDLEGDDVSVADAFRQIAGELRAIEAPATIASSWDAMSRGLDRMADAFGEVDVADLDSLEALDRAEGDLTAAGDEVDRHLRDECGL